MGGLHEGSLVLQETPNRLTASIQGFSATPLYTTPPPPPVSPPIITLIRLHDPEIALIVGNPGGGWTVSIEGGSRGTHDFRHCSTLWDPHTFPSLPLQASWKDCAANPGV